MRQVCANKLQDGPKTISIGLVFLIFRGRVKAYAPDICAKPLPRWNGGAKNVPVSHICARDMRLHVHSMSINRKTLLQHMRLKCMRLVRGKQPPGIFAVKLRGGFWQPAICFSDV